MVIPTNNKVMKYFVSVLKSVIELSFIAYYNSFMIVKMDKFFTMLGEAEYRCTNNHEKGNKTF